MESGNRGRNGFTGLAAIVAASILVWFGSGLDPWWPLLWFAPFPVLAFALRSSWRRAAAVAGLSLLIGGLNFWHYLRVLGTPASVWFGVFSIAALVFSADVLLLRALLRRGAVWTALVAFPALWVSYEYLRNLTTPHGTAGSFAYSQLSFLPFLQLASITGPWGMTFVLLLFPVAIAIFLYLRASNPAQARRVLATAMCVIGAVLIFGAIRLALPLPRPAVKVGLVASDKPANADVAGEGAPTERLFRDYAAQAENLSRQGAQIIVLPEKLGVMIGDDRKTDAIFQSLADRTRSTIVAGMVHTYSTKKYNQARVYVPEAEPLSYNKRHMLPPFESMFTPGTTLTLLSRPAGTIGVAICKDMDFTPLSRRYGRAGSGLILIPAWDFNLDRAGHGHIALMRGVENGFGLVRAAKNGYLTVSDSRGRILAEVRSDGAPFATLTASVPVAHEATLYILFGDWFAWLSLALMAFSLAQLYRLRR